MKITIIGASAGIGLATVRQALTSGHTVTALARNTDGIPGHHLLTKINGSATVVANVKQAITGAEAVIVTIGTKDKKGTTLFADTANALLQAAAQLHFTALIIVVTGFGTGASSKYLSFFMRMVINLFLKDQYQNKTRMEELLMQSELKWLIVKPGMLSNGPLTRVYKVIPELYPAIKIGKISREDVADFLLRQAVEPTLLYQQVAITG